MENCRLALFHRHFLMIIQNNLLLEIKNYCKDNPFEETCGFIVESDNNLIFIPIKNRHLDKKNYFLISPKDYIEIKNKYKIEYFFHSHLSNPFFSKLDILYQKYHNIDMLLYNVSTDELKEMKCK